MMLCVPVVCSTNNVEQNLTTDVEHDPSEQLLFCCTAKRLNQCTVEDWGAGSAWWLDQYAVWTNMLLETDSFDDYELMFSTPCSYRGRRNYDLTSDGFVTRE